MTRAGRSSTFTTHHRSLEKQKVIYLLTDYFAYQFGGPKGKKFKCRQLKSILSTIEEMPMKEQGEVISETFREWKWWPDENGFPKSLEQVDDMTIVRIRI